MSVKTSNGTVVFIEKEGGHVGGEGPMRERPHHALGGEEVGGPPSPLLR